MFKKPELTPIQQLQLKQKRELMKRAAEKFDRENPPEPPKVNPSSGWVL